MTYDCRHGEEANPARVLRPRRRRHPDLPDLGGGVRGGGARTAADTRSAVDPKTLGVEVMHEQFAAWGYAAWFATVVGVIEVVGAVLLLIPRVAFYGAVLLLIVMGGAVYTHLSNDEASQVFRPLIFLFVLGMIAMMRRRPRSA